MKILFCNTFISLTSNSIQKALKRMGHNCVERTYYTPEDLYGDRRLDEMVKKDLANVKPDIVFSVNFWPGIARVCAKQGIKYISYAYDSPQNIPQTKDMDYETNYIFFFDKQEVQAYLNQGIDRAFYMPLATDVSSWDTFRESEDLSCEISLVGQLYESTFPMLMSAMDDYLQGFYKGLIASQQQIFGYYMIEDLIDDERLLRTNDCLKKRGINATKRQLSFSVGSYITRLDRINLLNLLQRAGEVTLFTGELDESQKSLINGVRIKGKVDYETRMPVVFKSTKINLNPILRVIKSGIPQRALDVMGCRAFLLSSYQPELAEYFIPDEEVVMFGSYEDAIAKADFYLRNNDIREKIASCGYEKVKKYFTYEARLSEMFEIAGV